MRLASIKIPLCLILGVSLGTGAVPAWAQLQPESLQSADRIEWWPKLEAIESMLSRHKWKGARKQAERVTEQALREAWSGQGLDRVMAELALQRAIAEMNLGRPNDAVWHWYLALNLAPEIASRDLSAYGLASTLSGIELRREAEMPREFGRVSDLERLHMEPVVFPQVAPPDLVTNTAAALDRQPDVLIELIVDATGRLRQPVLLTDDAHPVLVFVAFEWLAGMPPAQPARLDGRTVDSLEIVNASFAVERTGGQIFLPPVELPEPRTPPPAGGGATEPPSSDRTRP